MDPNITVPGQVSTPVSPSTASGTIQDLQNTAVVQNGNPVSSQLYNYAQESLDTRSPNVLSDQANVLNEPVLTSTPAQNAANQKTVLKIRDKDTRRLVTRVVGSALLIIVLLFGAGLFARRFSSNQAVDPVAQVEEQEVASLQTDEFSTLSVSADGTTLLVNGNILATESLQVSSGQSIGRLILADGASNQTYTLPNTSGIFCLDSNNCNFLQTADLPNITETSLAGVSGNIALGAGLVMNGTTLVNSVVQTSVNNSTGDIILQGTNNQVIVAQVGDTITLTTPQDIAATSSPTFNTITLSGIGTQNGNTICDSSNNCGYAGGTDSFIQDGNSFGEAAVLGTNDNFSLAFETNATTRMTISNSGVVDIGGHIAIGANANVDDATLGFNAAETYSNVLTVEEEFTNFTVQNTIGIAVNLGLNPGGAVSNDVAGMGAGVEVLSGNAQNFSGNLSGASGSVVHSGTGSIAEGSGVIGVYSGLGAGTGTSVAGVRGLLLSSAGTITEGRALRGQVISLGGTINTAYGLQIEDTINAGGSIGTNYGIRVGSQTAGSTDYGVAIESADTQTLWLASNLADPTTSSAGIAFGSSRDTNLYRSAANTLSTDDSLTVAGSIDVAGRGAIGDSASVSTLTGLVVSETFDAGNVCGSGGCYGIAGSAIISSNQSLGIGIGGGVQTAAGAITLSTGAGFFAINPVLGAGSTITNNYGLLVQDQTSGTNDYGIAIEGADTAALWLGSGGNHTDAANGILFGQTTSTSVNLYRSADNTLRTDDNLSVGNGLSVTRTSTDTTGAILDTAANITYTDTGIVTTGSDNSYGQFINVARTGATGGTINTFGQGISLSGDMAGAGTHNLVGSNVGVVTNADSIRGYKADLIIGGTASTVSEVIGFDSNIDTYLMAGTITNAYGMQVDVNASTSGTITNAAGLIVQSPTIGGPGSIGTAYGIQVKAQTAAGSDYGIAVEAADTQTLWLSSNANNTTAAAGIAFGSSRDTNLYRSAANVLRTDDAFSVGTLGVTNTAAYLCLNASNQLAACSSSGSGTAFIQDGNSFGAPAVIGTNDNQSLYIETNNQSIAAFTTDGALQLQSIIDSDMALATFNVSGVVPFRVDTIDDQVILGDSGNATGRLLFNNASNSNTILLTSATATGTRTITLPDASGTVLLDTTATGVQTANFAFQSSAAGTVVGALRAHASQTANLQEWQNSGGTALSVVTATGNFGVGGTSASDKLTVHNGDIRLQRSDTTGTQISSYWGGSTSYGLHIGSNLSSTSSYSNGYGVRLGTAFTSDPTSGSYSQVVVRDNFAPTSGTAISSALSLDQIINQTGGANGITRGIYLNPTLTAAADYRALEIGNNSQYAIYQSGANATNYLAGTTKINSTGTAGTDEKLRVNTPTTIDNDAAVIFSAGAADQHGLVVQGAGGQTANLQEWQNSSGTTLASIGTSAMTLTNLDLDFLTTGSTDTVLTGQQIGAAVQSFWLGVDGTMDWGNGATSLDVSMFRTGGVGAGGLGVSVATTFSVNTDEASGYVMDLQNDGNNQNRYGMRIQAGADDGSGTTYYLDAYDGDGTQVGYLANTAGTFAVTDVSDIRTKTNVEDSSVDAMEVLSGLRVVDFNRLQNPDGPRITGFIAQEVQSVYGQAVTTSSEGYLGIMKEAFIPVLVKGHQEQQRQIDVLRSQVSMLQGFESSASLTVTSLKVEGIATIAKLEVTGAATVGTLTVEGDARIAGDLKVEGKVIGTSLTRGTVVVQTGATKVEYEFAEAYAVEPNVILTPRNTFAPSYRVEATEEGFTLYLKEAATENITFNYQVQQ